MKEGNKLDFWSYIAPSIPAYKLKQVLVDYEKSEVGSHNAQNCYNCHASSDKLGVACPSIADLCSKELDRRAAVKKGEIKLWVK